MSQSAFKPVNRLEEVLVAASTDPSARPEFYRQLLESDLFVITPDVQPSQGPLTLPATANVAFLNFNGPKGQFLPIFSSRDQLQAAVDKMGKQFGFMAVAGKNLFPILTQHPQTAVLNPGAPYGKELLANEIKSIADGSIFQAQGKVIEKTTQVMLAQPAKYPAELVAALNQLFKKNDAVLAAYLAQIHNPASGEPPHLIIGIEVKGDFQRIVSEAGMVAQATAGKDEITDFIQVGAAGASSLDSYFKEKTRPFYQAPAKKSFWKAW